MDDDTRHTIWVVLTVAFTLCFVVSTITLVFVWSSIAIEREKAEICAKCPECSRTQNCDKQDEN